MCVLPGVEPVPFAAALGSHGDRPAVLTADGRLSYRELADRVAELAAHLGTARRLVLLAGANRVDELVAYLAALTAGHPLLLAPGDNDAATAALERAYDPDVVLRRVHGALTVDERRPASRHELHPELALLLSTSGSTGSPKLVRLSRANLQANAEAIAAYLRVRHTDRAATTLPMHYCYGLSVVNSHLLRGAALVLTNRSVADRDFWELFRAARGTALAGVPYTFELLDRVGFAEMHLPHLRYVTQAGGRLDPDRVTRYAALGRRRGFDLFVMYGQTEATARMAYLPPHLAATRPEAIGVPIPGGSFRLRPLPDRPEPDTGELVYTGPNVMLGYARTPADLALGRAVEELRTGDVARRAPDGLYEIVGRVGGLAKVFGLRVDLARVEEQLAARGVAACCVGTDRELVVAATGGPDVQRVRRLAAAAAGLPARAVRVHPVAELPRLGNGKPDRAALR
ncbi:AMP-dependent synthetase, partial [Micromonospora sp. KC207]|uniref:AMP-binding protein n=1 Tax=Micromonospora sp. KC207 TaxID=2530377 RepID=UPI0010E0AA82